MKNKSRLFTYVLALMAFVSVLTVGVFALRTASATGSGTIGFNPMSVQATINGKILNMETVNGSTSGIAVVDGVNEFTLPTITVKRSSISDVSGWANNLLMFRNDASINTQEELTITISVSITNDSTSGDDLYVNIENNSNNENMIYSSDGATAFAVAPNETKTANITFTVADLYSGLSGAPYNYLINLYNKHAVPDAENELLKYSVYSGNKAKVTGPKSASTIATAHIKPFIKIDSVVYEVDCIDEDAFFNHYEGCPNLARVIIPGSIKTILSRAFYKCGSLTSVEIPGSVTSIDQLAFYKLTSLRRINIPKSITSIHHTAFLGRESVTAIYVDGGNNIYSAKGNCLIKRATKELVLGCKTSVIPTDGSVTSIGQAAFEGCTPLTNIDIPNAVTTIGTGAFQNCSSLLSISLPYGLEIIEGYVFSGCTGLSSVDIPNGVTTIGRQAFYGCTSLTNLNISNVTSIGEFAFSGCTSLINIDMPNVITIDSYAFRGCTSLSNIDMPNVTTIGSYAFDGCTSLINIDMPNVTTIGSYAFNGCTSLINIDMPNVKTINAYAFYDCNSLTNIPGILWNLTMIGEYAFYGCRNLTGIGFVFVTVIGQSTFENCESFTVFSIPSSVVGIGGEAFKGCKNLSKVYIPTSVTRIVSNAFDNCSNLQYVYYYGTQSQWTALGISLPNTVSIIYNYTPPTQDF